MQKLEVIHLSGQPDETTVADVLERLRSTNSNGFNSIEVTRIGTAWPLLSILINRDWGVVHRTEDEDGQRRMYLLEGTPSKHTPKQLEFKILEGEADFTSEYIHPLVDVEEVIRAFASNKAWPDRLKWVEL